MVDKTLAFIGGGNMAGSIIGGLLNRGFEPAQLRVSDIVEANRDRFSEMGLFASDDSSLVIQGADAVILAVKPQQLKDVCESIAPALQQNRPLLISIAAGVEVAAIQQWVGYDAAVVRCMPNTPALVLTGASGLYAAPGVSDEQRELATAALEAVGIVVWVDSEEKLHAVTAVSGSGPAYMFLMMEAMVTAGHSLGLSPETARELTAQTALGAARMVQGNDEDIAELRRRVTSPGGTTERAIRVFEERGLRRIFEDAMEACDKRSRELGEELR